MTTDKDGAFKMRNMRDIMDASVKDNELPSNLLHLF
jgi:hypothetical protein